MSDPHPSVRAIVCTAHLMLAQNAKAELRDDDWPIYLSMVADWCLEKFKPRGVAVYWSPGIHEGTRH